MTLAILLCEGLVRVVLNPADFLSPRMISDDIRGIVIEPNSAGFDEWGFRNSSVPDAVEIVAVGDSHTYGNNAAMADSWPYVAGELAHRSVYNAGLGGYGPNRSYHVLTTQALKLRPKWVLCGLYFGDDFENAFSMTYGLDYWSALRRGSWNTVDANIWATPGGRDWHRQVRDWLSRSSVIYRLLVHGPLLEGIKTRLQRRRAELGSDPSTATLVVPDQQILEAFRPEGIRSRLDVKSPAVREGMRVTFDLLRSMNLASRQAGSRFAVVLIPTKETVFAELLNRDVDIKLKSTIQELIADEATARAELTSVLDEEGIPYIDALQSLRLRVRDHLYTRGNQDMHPGRNGYRVIGEAVAQFLRRETQAASPD